MSKSKVYFTNFRTSTSVSLLKKLKNLLKASGIEQLDCKDKFTAIKIHFGEHGNVAHLRPQYARAVVDLATGYPRQIFFLGAADEQYLRQRHRSILDRTASR